MHDWVRRKKDTKNRKEALKDHLPSLSAFGPEKAPKGKCGEGTGKDKNGDPQVCFPGGTMAVVPRRKPGRASTHTLSQPRARASPALRETERANDPPVHHGEIQRAKPAAAKAPAPHEAKPSLM